MKRAAGSMSHALRADASWLYSSRIVIALGGASRPGLSLSPRRFSCSCRSGSSVPAPNPTLLTLGVGAPELSPLLLAVSLALCALALITAGTRTIDRTAGYVAATAAILCALPLARFPVVVQRFDMAIAALGHEDASPSAYTVGPRSMRAHPLTARDLVLGIEAGESRVVRGVEFAAPAGTPLTVDIYRPVSGRAASDPRSNLRRRLAAGHTRQRRRVRAVFCIAWLRRLRD